MKFDLIIDESGMPLLLYEDGVTGTLGDYECRDGKIYFSNGEILPQDDYNRLVITYDLFRASDPEELSLGRLAPSSLLKLIESYFFNDHNGILFADFNHVPELAQLLYKARNQKREEDDRLDSSELIKDIESGDIVRKLADIYGFEDTEQNIEELIKQIQSALNKEKPLEFMRPDFDYGISCYADQAITVDQADPERSVFALKSLTQESAYRYSLNITGLKKHRNAEGKDGYWAGIAFVYTITDGQEPPVSVRYSVSGHDVFETPVEKNVGLPKLGNLDGDGVAFYFNHKLCREEYDNEISLQWISADGKASPIHRFVIHTKVTLDNCN